jgi:hypothetical protein
MMACRQLDFSKNTTHTTIIIIIFNNNLTLGLAFLNISTTGIIKANVFPLPVTAFFRKKSLQRQTEMKNPLIVYF